MNVTGFWRRFFFDPPHCVICIDDERWGKICCWDCEHLENCIQNWIKSSVDFSRHDPCVKSGKGREKKCSQVFAIWKRKKGMR